MSREPERVAAAFAGGCAVLGSIFSFFYNGFDFFNILLTAAGFAFVAYIISFAGALILNGAFEQSKQHNNPFVKGITFASFIVFGLGAFDLILMRGTFIVGPAISVLTNQSLEGTFWKCEDWVSEEEGSYCADD